MYRAIFLWVTLFVMTGCGQPTPQNVIAYRIQKPKKSSVKTAIKEVGLKRREVVPTIVIDPGHGGYDPGAFNHYIEEKDACLRCAKLLRKHLEKMGYHVILTRSQDVFIPLQRRADMANQAHSQLFVSLHFNSAPNKAAKGIEIYYAAKAESWRLKRAKEAAKLVLDSILTHTKAESRGVKGGDFLVIRETKMPSILIEAGFITNDEERKKIADERYLNTLAVSIAEGVDSYFDTVSKNGL